MRFSIFSTIVYYLREVWQGAGSIARSSMTAIPYVFGAGELCKEVTEQYPDPISSKTADDLPPRTRGLLYNDIERCTGCRECERACPANCIRVVTEPGPEVSKLWVADFDIDFSRCIFCGICTEVCAPSSLTHTKQYEGAVYALPNLVASFGLGRVTTEQLDKWVAIRKQNEEDEARDGDTDPAGAEALPQGGPVGLKPDDQGGREPARDPKEPRR